MNRARRRIHLTIRGRVQGVGYRASAAAEARARGLRGWVRNLEGGEVELVAEGPAEGLTELHAWCRRGPAGARVDAITEEMSAATDEFAEFSIRRDG